MKKVKLVVFDVDGTIIDSFHQNYLSAKAFVARHSDENLTEDDYRQVMSGNPWEELMKLGGLEVHEKMELSETDDFYSAYGQNKVFDGMADILSRIYEKFPMAIVTSTFIPPVTELFEREGIDTLFSAYLGPEVSIRKDAKLQMLAKEYQVHPKEILFISDTVGDILEGKKAGVRTVGVTWGFNTPEEIEAVKPDIVVTNPRELLGVLSIS